MRTLFTPSIVLILIFSFVNTGVADLVDNGDGTITDTETKLIWLKNAGPARMQWAVATDWANTLDFAAINTWRLPTALEMEDLYYRGLGGERDILLHDFGPFNIQPFGAPPGDFRIWSSSGGEMTRKGVTNFSNGRSGLSMISNYHLYWAVYNLYEDSDSDGISDIIDSEPGTDSNDFSDGTTTGTISNPGDQTVSIKPGEDGGILIITDAAGGTEAATVTVCGGTVLTLGADSRVLVTCGSATVKVINGSVGLTFYVDGWTQAKVNINEGNQIRFESTTLTLTAESTNSDIIVFDVEGTEYSLSPGESKTIDKCPLPIGLLVVSFIAGLLLGLLICWLRRKKT